MSNKLKAATTSIIANVALLSGKMILAVFTGSIGLFAESTHSLFDLLASIFAYAGVKKAEQPEDHTHHYGHEKYETLSSFIQSLLITGTSFIVMWEAYQKILSPTPVENSEWGIAFIVISIPIAYLISRYLSRMARKEGGSHALEADSAHFTTDIMGSVAVLAGLLMVKFGMPLGDPLAAFAVGLVMLYISVKLCISSFHVFMDHSPDRKKVRIIENVLKKAIKNGKITRYHKLRARMVGSKILLEFHIHVSKKMSIVKAHQIASDIKNEIKRKVHEVKDATIHIEPD
ncbi:cation transporter [archaeon]|nr:MAG: cation transporter [archaeon]